MEIVDCTCVKVKNIHKIVAEKENVIIIGKKIHPEVLGIYGWCKNAVIAETEADLTEIPKAPLCVVGQTTCNKDWWDKAVAIIKDNNPTAEVHNTLCDVAARRIKIAVETAKKSEILVCAGSALDI